MQQRPAWPAYEAVSARRDVELRGGVDDRQRGQRRLMRVSSSAVHFELHRHLSRGGLLPLVTRQVVGHVTCTGFSGPAAQLFHTSFCEIDIVKFYIVDFTTDLH